MSTCDVYQSLTRAGCPGNAQLYQGNVEPFVNLTVKMWLWYQVRRRRAPHAAREVGS